MLVSMTKESATLLTLFDIKDLIRQVKDSAATIDWKPLYLLEVLPKPYPSDYEVSNFQKYDSRSDDSRKHVMCFLESMGRRFDNKGLYLKEFSKSLSKLAYTWYASLKSGVVRD